MKKALRGQILTFKNDPFLHPMDQCLHFLSDGIIVIENGMITAVDDAENLLFELKKESVTITEYRDSIISAGFIDSHVHYAQTEIIGAYGEQLIDWLNNYTFIAEQNFKSREHSDEVADIFINEQLKNGVTSATVFATIFPQSVDAIFEAADRRNMRFMAGKVCMDRNAPDGLRDTAQSAYDDSKALINRWHGHKRLEYVITPRFAPTSTHEQLEMLGALAAEHPDALIQSHVSENIDEVAWVKSLFPNAKSYADVYADYGLMRERAIYGHGIYLTDDELSLIYERGAAVAHCPTSNFFLGSGAFDLKKAKLAKRPIHVGLGTDLGAGTSFSIFQTMGEAYKAGQLNGYALSSLHAFYLATRGTADALGLSEKVGTIAPGMEADLVVIDLKSTPIIEYRMNYVNSLEEALFVQMTLADDRAVKETIVAGESVYQRD